ncbi:alpha/beta hydrolase [Rouxiella silvae]|uniref:Alpha/beta hydrolase n=1 Tax=Rouxiella silvae TaxID=1646373 RepID=A0AA40X4P8_9GAMM|nr:MULTISPECIES: alpha/beta hydrolase [Rouxiella]KAB7894803.1 alpha/beta hydrolase [Rouxiella sp. S1S-2]KQN48199.1 3-hydroxydecanoyl-ACP:CoA transacylase [Serratia sp. Leaf50]MBF6638485.1 alpha/beta hydrolase [Rouxiella silvae]ORJ19767.1 alpha/beta hydrolase [Rouxiella silvae]
MKPESEVVHVGDWRVYIEKYIYPDAKETVICVNGALSTTLAFRNCVRNLKDKVNIILFDLPFIGGSREHNTLTRPIPKAEEVEILKQLIDIYKPEYLLSVSWGGLATLMALASQPASVTKAIVTSFSTRVTPAMETYIQRAKQLLDEGKNDEVATLLNNEVGKFLPSILKRANHHHISSLDQDTYRQASFHIDQISRLKEEDYIDIFHSIKTPLVFINGDLDEYTTAEDIRHIANHIENCEFATVPQAGHFLDMENRSASQHLYGILSNHFAA